MTAGQKLAASQKPSQPASVGAGRTLDGSVYQRVSYDDAPSTLATPILTEPFGVKRQNFDVDLRFFPRSAFTARVRSFSNAEGRVTRIFRETTENITRLTVGSVGTRWLFL